MNRKAQHSIIDGRHTPKSLLLAEEVVAGNDYEKKGAISLRVATCGLPKS